MSTFGKEKALLDDVTVNGGVAVLEVIWGLYQDTGTGPDEKGLRILGIFAHTDT